MPPTIRRRGDNGLSAWPGYVDALSTLLMVIIFVLLVFVLAQGFLSVALTGRDKQLDLVNRQLAEMADMLSLEKGRNADLSKSIGQLNRDLAATTAAGAALTQRFAALKDQAERAGTERDTLRGERDRFAQQLADAALQAQAATARNDALQAQLVDAARRVDLAGQETTKVAGQLADTRRQLTDTSQQLTRTNTQLADTAHRLDAATQENTQVAGQLADTRRQLTDTNQQLASTTAQLTDTAHRLDAAGKENTQLAGQLAEARRQLADTNQQLASTTAQLTDTAHRLDAASQENTQVAGQLADARRRLADTNQQLADAKAQLAAMRQQMAELDRTVTADKATIEARLSDIARMTEHVRALTALRDDLEKQAQTAAASATTEQQHRAAAEAQLGDEKRLGDSARAQLALLNQQVDALKAQLTSVAQALDLAKTQDRSKETQIESLNAKLNVALAAKVEELQRYRSEFFGRLRDVLANRPGIQVVGDRFVFQSEVLFPVGSADLTPTGQTQMTAIAVTIKDIAAEIPSGINWILRVDGHTDRQPIKGLVAFPSNWELSAARAITVVKLLIADGVPAEHLAATGFSDNQPLEPGDTPDAYAKNRRIELRLTDR